MVAFSAEIEQFGRSVCELFGIEPDERLVVGASGGLDSTVLLRLLHEAGFAAVAAHVNYGLRGEASDGDEAFVRALGDELDTLVFTKRVALPDRGNMQAAAREARYAFFGEVATEANARVVAVAHHQNDQAETVLLNLFRGTGLQGLSGMTANRPLYPGSEAMLIRPLLDWKHDEIEQLALAHGWKWREDASNECVDYRRNAIRKAILPQVREYFGDDVEGRIAGAANLVRAFSGEAGPIVTLNELGEVTPRGGALRVEDLLELTETRRHALYLFALAEWAPEAPRRGTAVGEMDGLLDAQTGKRITWPGVTIWRERDSLLFERLLVDDGISESFGNLETDAGAIRMRLVVPADVDRFIERTRDDRNTELVDGRALSGQLNLRPWQKGDRFRPFGFAGTKLVSDLLTDRKTPPSDKAHQLVLCVDGKIVWIVGHRLSHEAGIHSDTEQIIQMTWSPVEPPEAHP